MGKSDAVALPPWGTKAKELCQFAFGIFVILSLFGWVAQGFDAVSSWDIQGWLREETPLKWPVIVLGAGSLAAAVIFGLVWLAGSFASGFNEPKNHEPDESK